MVCGPRTLVPRYISSLGVKVEFDLRKALEWCDVANMLRIQLERQDIRYFPSIREYTMRYGLDKAMLDSLSKKITVDVKGEILELKNTINVMVDQLNGFASEVTRVAREVGTEGRLGGQAEVPGVAGTWKDLTDNVNSMASNLTGQVRNIAEVATAVAQGDLSKKITVTVSGEILQLKEAINTMVDQLNGFAAEVTRVAREVGTEGILGGQAEVPGVAGTWKRLTDSVNAMRGRLTLGPLDQHDLVGGHHPELTGRLDRGKEVGGHAVYSFNDW